jgi:hypothetical protein
MEQLTKEAPIELVTANPNNSLSIKTKTLPAKITIVFKKKIDIKGILYIPEQRERRRDCYPKDCEIVEAGMEIVLHNNSRSQEILFNSPIYTDRLNIIVKSTYGDWNAPIWKENSKGYFIGESDRIINVEIAGIHIICNEKAPHSDVLFWNGEQMSTTKEIDA